MPKRLTDEQRGPLGARLFARRTALGLEQRDVATHIGISLSGYRQWETGNVARPNPHHLASAAEILETSPAYLQTGREVDEDVIETLRSEIAQMRDELAAYLERQSRD